jgi:hypothetical protein
MNSLTVEHLQQKFTTKQTYDKDKNPKKIKFKKPFEGIVEDWYEELTIIEDITNIDIFEWCDLFEDLKNANKWDKTIQKQLLRRLVRDPAIKDRGLKDTWKEVRQQLINAVYPIEKLNYYKKRLRCTYQKNFEFIKDYYDELKYNIKIIKELTQKTNDELQELLYDAFHEGLSNHTYAKIIDQNFTSTQQCFNYLETIERKAMAKFESKQTFYERETLNNHINYNNSINNMNENDFNDYENNYNDFTDEEYDSDYELNNDDFNEQNTNSRLNEQNNNKTHDSRFNKNKYCKLHRFGNHSTEECDKYDPDYYKKRNTGTKQLDPETHQNYMIQPLTKFNDLNTIYGIIYGHRTKLMIDSGSSKSFISRKTIDKIQTTTKKVKFGNNKKSTINDMVTLKILLEGTNITILQDLYVLENLNEKIILGHDFLVDYETMIDYKNCNLIIGRNIIPFVKHKEIQLNLNDKTLTAKQSLKNHDINPTRDVIEITKTNENEQHTETEKIEHETNNITKPHNSLDTNYKIIKKTNITDPDFSNKFKRKPNKTIINENTKFYSTKKKVKNKPTNNLIKLKKLTRYKRMKKTRRHELIRKRLRHLMN